MPNVDEAWSVRAWAASGAMELTGPRDASPLGPPAPLVHNLDAIADVLVRRSAQFGRAVRIEPLGLLAERAAIAGLGRNGQVSAGGATRLLRTADGWIAVALPRPDDIDLVPAWLQVTPPSTADDVWDVVARAVATRPDSDLVERATLLGMAVGALPQEPNPAPSADAPLAPLPCAATRVGDAERPDRLDDLVVADLSSLWAGPLCGSLLQRSGATVLKVESTGRPDGARRGPAAFFDLLNAGKRGVAVDFATPDGRRTLGALLERVDVVIEASRPRALEQLGIDARALLTQARPRVWVSITGHGRTGVGQERVAFGDDAAVAGGLVAWDGDEPCFCADAVADPTSGLVAAAAVTDALANGGRWLIDVSLAGVASHLAGPTLPVPGDVRPAPPTARAPVGSGPRLGADTAAVLDELGVGS